MPDYNSEADAVYPAIVEPLLAWYAAAARTLPWRENRDPYRVWVSEIMLQQTRVEAVRAYYLRFMETFPDVHALAEAPEDTLLKAWEGLGYYARARNLQKTARIVAARYGGVFPAAATRSCSCPESVRTRRERSPRSVLICPSPQWTATCCASPHA